MGFSVHYAPPARAIGLLVYSTPAECVGETAEADGCFVLESDLPHGQRAPASQLGLERQEPYSLRILLVDDTIASRRLAELILKHQGHCVEAASNGKEAVQLAKELTWDLILMDLQMPVMNGWQATQAIRRHEKLTGQSQPVPIVALTAYDVAGNRQRSLEIGMNDFLTKPIDPQLLVDMVEQHGHHQPDAP